MLPNALRPSATDHIPVLADEVRRLLDVQPGAAVVDATFGAGGHAELLALDMGGKGRFIAIDRDPSARQYFERFRKRAGVQARFLRGEFATVLDQLATNDVRVDAILLDLGVSSMQVDRPERGFSYAVDAPLDMRMDPSADETAADIVNDAPERELLEIFRRYGEERYAPPDRSCHHTAPPARAVRPHGRARRRDQDRHPDARSLRRGASRPGASSRRSGSRSTTSSASSKRLYRRRFGCCVRAAGSPSSASTRWRIESSNGSSGPRPAAACVRLTSRSARAARIPRCAC